MIVYTYSRRPKSHRSKSGNGRKQKIEKDFVLCQWEVDVIHKDCGILVSDELGEFYVGDGQYMWGGNRLRLHKEFEIEYMN